MQLMLLLIILFYSNYIFTNYFYCRRMTSALRRNFIAPGPNMTDVLHLQHVHRSTAIWNETSLAAEVLRCRQHRLTSASDPPQPIDSRILDLVELAGFKCIHHFRNIRVDQCLIMALVERWRPETHMFHMPNGELSITLEDVLFITGLSMDGHAVIDRTNDN